MIKKGEAVRFEYLHGRIFFGYLIDSLEIADGKIVSPDDFFFDEFDPLTSEVILGLGQVNSMNVRSLEQLSLPVTIPFLIDSVAMFYRNANRRFVYETPSDPEGFALEFIRRFTEFANDIPELITRSMASTEIQSESLSEIGLTFFRVHYRQVKKESVQSKTLPKGSSLLSLFNKLCDL